MRNWGIIVSIFYAIVVLVLFTHGLVTLANMEFDPDVVPTLDEWLQTLLIAWPLLLVGGQALLLFLSVDTRWRRLHPRQSARRTAITAGALLALLATAALMSAIAAVSGDENGLLGALVEDHWWIASVLLFWVFWAVVFKLYHRGDVALVDAAVGWLLRGSVLELLVAVPSHVIVRHRGDCSAPAATSWGIVTGLAVMFAAFGPGVLALYRKRIEEYRAPENASG